MYIKFFDIRFFSVTIWIYYPKWYYRITVVKKSIPASTRFIIVDPPPFISHIPLISFFADMDPWQVMSTPGGWHRPLWKSLNKLYSNFFLLLQCSSDINNDDNMNFYKACLKTWKSTLFYKKLYNFLHLTMTVSICYNIPSCSQEFVHGKEIQFWRSVHFLKKNDDIHVIIQPFKKIALILRKTLTFNWQTFKFWNSKTSAELCKRSNMREICHDIFCLTSILTGF